MYGKSGFNLFRENHVGLGLRWNKIEGYWGISFALPFFSISYERFSHEVES